MNIFYRKRAIHYIHSCDKQVKQRLKTAIEQLPLGDVKKLKGFQSEYRLRVGSLRVLFTLEDDTIIINDIGSRGQIYKGL